MRPFLFLLPLCTAAVAGTVNYTAVTLTTTQGDPGETVVATSLNNAGQVAGYEYAPNQALIPLVWNGNGVPARILMPPGYSLAFGSSSLYLLGPKVPAINDASQILVPAVDRNTGDNVGVLVSGNTYTIIGAAPNSCGAMKTIVFGMNSKGSVVGGTIGNSCRVFWVWDNGTFTMLSPPHPAHFLPGGINDLGHVLGIDCLNVPGEEGCESGPILDLEPGGEVVTYKDEANGISPPNNSGQVTGYVLAGPGEDNFFWMNATSSPLGIPPNGRFASQSVAFTNPNDSGYLIFLPLDSSSYAIMHDSNIVGSVSGGFLQNGALVTLNNRMQFVTGPYLCSPAQ
jgi:hypothetical protein